MPILVPNVSQRPIVDCASRALGAFKVADGKQLGCFEMAIRAPNGVLPNGVRVVTQRRVSVEYVHVAVACQEVGSRESRNTRRVLKPWNSGRAVANDAA